MEIPLLVHLHQSPVEHDTWRALNLAREITSTNPSKVGLPSYSVYAALEHFDKENGPLV